MRYLRRVGWPRCALLLLLAAGCLAPKTEDCEGGGVCPAGLKCVTDSGDHGRELCVAPTCGNGILDPGEACDDGNSISGDGCPADCSPACGYGVLDPGEVCNPPSPGTCSADCMSNLTCGNAVVDPQEGCDDGNLQEHDGCSSACIEERPAWTSLGDVPPARVGGALVYDAARATAVLFGGCTLGPTTTTGSGFPTTTGCQGAVLDDTWQWDGARWARRTSTTPAPPPRFGHAMAYDPDRDRVVLFGGCADSASCDNPLGDTWEWDGTSWEKKTSTTAPPNAFAHAMAYDAGRKRVVLFGGCASSSCTGAGSQGGVWEWDGASWTQRPSSVSPQVRGGLAMAYDAARGKVVLFGGATGMFAPLGDTWEWDGASWTQRTPASAPAPRMNHAMAYDATRGRIVLFAGCTASTPPLPFVCDPAGLSGETWEWDGTSWAERAPTARPPARLGHAMTYDSARAQIVIFGGQDGARVALGDTWEDDGTEWHDRLARVPPARRFHALAGDEARGETLLFGGGNCGPTAPRGDTWTWDGSAWAERTPTAGPVPRGGLALAYDSARQRVVLFGGCAQPSMSSVVFGDTWEWDGASWLQRAPATSPSARANDAMAYDRGRGRVVLFGGQDLNGNPLGDTWEWDGSDWVQRTPTTLPPARWSHALAYDAGRGKIVMFGGCQGPSTGDCTLLGDTWEWDGTNWAASAPVAAPPARAAHAMSYDTASGQVVLSGGCRLTSSFRGKECASAPLDDLWTWDGTSWTLQTPATRPSARAAHAMAYDPARGTLVVVGGVADSSQSLRGDTWDGDATGWLERSDVTSPPGGAALLSDSQLGYAGSALAFDVARGNSVLFDGDTWELGATGWSKRALATIPAVRGPLVYDAARANVVMFGSPTSGGGSETWTWDGLDWRRAASAIQPTSRVASAMAYDADRGRVVLFGGCASPDPSTCAGSYLDDTWEWDGASWSAASPATRPPARIGHALAFDAARGRIVLFGGSGVMGGLLGDTWAWDGTTWSELAPATAPLPRLDHAMAYNPARKRVVLFGGLGLEPRSDTWEWDGTTWRELAPAGAITPRASSGMTYDTARDELVLFGGVVSGTTGDVDLSDTWFLRFDAP